MKTRRAAMVIGLLIAISVAAMALDRGCHREQRARAERLLQEALELGVLSPISATGLVGAHVGEGLQERAAGLELVGNRSRIRLGDGAVTLVDDGQSIWRLDETAQSATALGRSDHGIDWDLLRANYRAQPVGTTVIAGREARGVRLVDRRTRTAALEAWIDPKTRAILRRQSWDADGHLVASTELTELKPGALDARIDVPEGWAREGEDDAAGPLTPAEFAAGADFTPQLPAYLPKGFREAGIYSLTCPNGRAYAELRYFDGLRVVVIHEHRPRNGGQGMGMGPGGGRGRHGVDREPVLIDQGQAKTVRYRRADLRIVVTGDLPPEEILLVLDSIPRIPES